MTPSGIEPVTFRFVEQHLNHCATAVPVKSVLNQKYKFGSKIDSKPALKSTSHENQATSFTTKLRGPTYACCSKQQCWRLALPSKASTNLNSHRTEGQRYTSKCISIDTRKSSTEREQLYIHANNVWIVGAGSRWWGFCGWRVSLCVTAHPLLGGKKKYLYKALIWHH